MSPTDQLLSYAKEVFALFSGVCEGNGSVATSDDPCLTQAGFVCAFEVLFGGAPSASMIEVIAPTKGSVVHETSFLRFICSYAEQYGAEVPDSILVGSSLAARGRQPSSPHKWSAGAWALFEALAGQKRYLTLDDLVAADHHLLFEGLKRAAVASTEDDLPASKQHSHALLAHIFDVVDSDHDGRLQFSDVAPFLA